MKEIKAFLESPSFAFLSVLLAFYIGFMSGQESIADHSHDAEIDRLTKKIQEFKESDEWGS